MARTLEQITQELLGLQAMTLIKQQHQLEVLREELAKRPPAVATPKAASDAVKQPPGGVGS